MKEVKLSGFKAWAIRNKNKSFRIECSNRAGSCPIATYIAEKTGEKAIWVSTYGHIGNGNKDIGANFDASFFVTNFDSRFYYGDQYTGRDVLNSLRDVGL